jgi:hypothetical protein
VVAIFLASLGHRDNPSEMQPEDCCPGPEWVTSNRILPKEKEKKGKEEKTTRTGSIDACW